VNPIYSQPQTSVQLVLAVVHWFMKLGRQRLHGIPIYRTAVGIVALVCMMPGKNRYTAGPPLFPKWLSADSIIC